MLSLQQASSRILLASDSQLAPGALVKVRSSSPAINAELSRSLPSMIALDAYLELMYCPTKSNRSDDPKRGKEIAGASRELPEWWDELAAGSCHKFDMWLFERGLDDQKMSGLPNFSELCGNVSPLGILSTYLQQEGTKEPTLERLEEEKMHGEPEASCERNAEALKLGERALPAPTSSATHQLKGSRGKCTMEGGAGSSLQKWLASTWAG